jgi:hypothetical protein
MKVQEVILRAMAGKLKWWEAAEIIGVTDRTMRRLATELRGVRLRRFISPAAWQAESETDSGGDCREGVGAVSRTVL